MHLTQKTDRNKTNKPQFLNFFIKEHGQTDWTAKSAFDVGLIGDSYQHPLGFPLMDSSKGKLYDIELSLTDPTSSEYIDLDTSTYPIKGIYAINKTQLLKEPAKLAPFILLKTATALANREARHVFYLLFPFTFLTVSLVAFRNRRS
jgi:hypothetical protein